MQMPMFLYEILQVLILGTPLRPIFPIDFCDHNKKFRVHVYEKWSIPLHQNQRISTNIGWITHNHIFVKSFHYNLWFISAVLQPSM